MIDGGANSTNGNMTSVTITTQQTRLANHLRFSTNFTARTCPYVCVFMTPITATPWRQTGETSFAAPATKYDNTDCPPIAKTPANNNCLSVAHSPTVINSAPTQTTKPI